MGLWLTWSFKSPANEIPYYYTVFDTVDFSGTIEPVYGNLKDVIYIQFVPAFIIDPLLRENGQLANNAWWLQQSSPINIAGSFRNNKQEIVFSYLIGTEQTYIRYQVSGQRTN
jgi:hypothetical protein